MRSNFKKPTRPFTSETLKNHLIRYFLRNGRLRVNFKPVYSKTKKNNESKNDGVKKSFCTFSRNRSFSFDLLEPKIKRWKSNRNSALKGKNLTPRHQLRQIDFKAKLHRLAKFGNSILQLYFQLLVPKFYNYIKLLRTYDLSIKKR